MTRIDFYTDVTALPDFACKAVRTVYRKGESLLVVLSDQAALAELSARLWAFGDTGFLPHCKASDVVAGDTPVWLDTDFSAVRPGMVLLNLSAGMPSDPAAFSRILEVVGCDGLAKETARTRYRAYLGHGCEIHHHDMRRT